MALTDTARLTARTMDDPRSLRIEYIEARRVLLDALDALRPHLDAVVLIGAQAVYLRMTGRLPTYQPYTTDADIVLNPARLLDTPPLGKSMTDAGFILADEPGIWEAHFQRVGFADEIVVPVDLIVPEQVASKAGRRSARLPGEHGKNTARKSPGVEGTLVDYGPIEIASFEPEDTRSVVVNVAGEAALLVAKLHKLGDRLDKPERLQAKDAGDVYRLFDAVGPDQMAARQSRPGRSRRFRTRRTVHEGKSGWFGYQAGPFGGLRSLTSGDIVGPNSTTVVVRCGYARGDGATRPDHLRPLDLSRKADRAWAALPGGEHLGTAGLGHDGR